MSNDKCFLSLNLQSFEDDPLHALQFIIRKRERKKEENPELFYFGSGPPRS